jgi:trigger factor
MADEDTAVDREEDVNEEEAVDQEEGVEEEELSEDEQLMAKLKEAVEVEKEEIGALRLKLTVTVPRDTIDERMSEQFTELKREALVPGFRKGHAPMRLVEKRFGTDVGEDIKSQLIGRGYLAAVEREELNVLGDPLFWVKVQEERVGEDQRTEKVEVEKLLPLDKALDHMKLPKEEAISFACEIELKPEFELPELSKISIKRPAVTIDDDDVEAELKRMQMMRGTFAPVEDGSVEEDDLLYGDMKLTVEGEALASEVNFDMPARDTRVKGIPLVGFGEAVAGNTVGDTVTLEVTVPDDHENIDVRGKTATFEFKVSEIKRLEVPPIDEALLSSLGFETEDELRETIRASLAARLDGIIRRGMFDQIGEYLIEQTTLEIPEGLSQRQTDRSIARREIEMYQSGMPQAEVEKSIDELRAGAHDQAVSDLKLFFILEKIAEQRDITVSEERINAAIAEIARRSNKRFDRVRDELSKGDGLTALYLQLRDEQVLAALLEDAEITETKGPKKKRTAKKAKKKKTSKKKTS